MSINLAGVIAFWLAVIAYATYRRTKAGVAWPGAPWSLALFPPLFLTSLALSGLAGGASWLILRFKSRQDIQGLVIPEPESASDERPHSENLGRAVVPEQVSCSMPECLNPAVVHYRWDKWREAGQWYTWAAFVCLAHLPCLGTEFRCDQQHSRQRACRSHSSEWLLGSNRCAEPEEGPPDDFDAVIMIEHEPERLSEQVAV